MVVYWGRDLSTIAGMNYIGEGDSVGSLPPDLADIEEHIPKLQIYRRDEDKLKFGDVDLKSITYAFYKGKFLEVTLVSAGVDTWGPFKEEVFGRIGKGDRVDIPAIPCCGQKETELYYWRGDVSEAELTYQLSFSNAGMSNFWVASTSFREQLFNDARQDAKKVRRGAGKGKGIGSL